MSIINTLFIGKVLHRLSSVPSTNSYAFDLLSKSKPSEGTVISADEQVAGRGQFGSSWESAAGENSTVSIILYPSFLLARKQFELNKAISLAVKDLVSSYMRTTVQIKWPNDIYIKDKKVAGILIQNTLSGHKILASIVGIGINVRQESFSEAIPNATSFYLQKQQGYDLDEILARLCEFVEKRYLQLKKGDPTIDKNYLNSLYLFEKESRFARKDGSIFFGKIKGVTDIGELIIKHLAGEETFGFKEIKFL